MDGYETARQDARRFRGPPPFIPAEFDGSRRVSVLHPPRVEAHRRGNQLLTPTQFAPIPSLPTHTCPRGNGRRSRGAEE